MPRPFYEGIANSSVDEKVKHLYYKINNVNNRPEAIDGKLEKIDYPERLFRKLKGKK